jgi:serine/threonine-protein kinase HipA
MSRLKPSPRSRLTRSARKQLVALINGIVVGHVHQTGNGRLMFAYVDEWREAKGAHPLSLAMPLTGREHGDRAIRAFLWGLLPDNPDVLAWWARRYGVSPYKVVDLLRVVGEDCAGAVQFVAPERLEEVLVDPSAEVIPATVAWISEAQLETRLRDLRMNPAAGRAASDSGQFSLAGAQPKTALYQDEEGRWGIPRGRTPTNRILKPPTLGLDDLAYNEHFCLMLARTVGLPAATSLVKDFGSETTIILERYDRIRTSGGLFRIHQEDMCQAAAVLPTRKYEDDGGPGVAEIAEIIRDHSSEPEADLTNFIDAVAFNWLIAATDAHAKNYSVLHATGPQVRLAPLYDIITVLPYPQLNQGNSKLAMAIGGERRILEIRGSHWRRLAKSVGADPDHVMERVRDLGERLPAAVDEINRRNHPNEHAAMILSQIGASVVMHGLRCLDRLGNDA